MARTRTRKADDMARGPWSDLNPDLLLIILMQLGMVDFLALSGVCRKWRSIALSHKETFMACKEPLMVMIPPQAKRAFFLVDIFNRRRYRTSLPNFSGRMCLGLACGYLIMFGTKSYDFWLVNPVTRHELKFPSLPSCVPFSPLTFRAILVFSPILSKFVLVISFRYSEKILLSACSDADWGFVPCNTIVSDLHAFKGKIYVLDIDGDLGELRLNPIPALVLHKERKAVLRDRFMDFVSSSEKLFVLDFDGLDTYHVFEVDVNKMQRVRRENVEDHALFLSVFKGGAAVDFKNWSNPGKHLRNSTYYLPSPGWGFRWLYPSCTQPLINMGLSEEEALVCIDSNVWYFPSDCYNVDRLLE